MKNPCLIVAKAELSIAGIRDVITSYGGKHLQIRWITDRGERIYTMPTTPSDVRSEANTRADIRRMLREDGYLTPVNRPLPSRLPSLAERIANLERRLTALEESRIP